MSEQINKTERFLSGCPLWVVESGEKTLTLRNVGWCTVTFLVLRIGEKALKRELSLEPAECVTLNFEEDISDFIIDGVITKDNVCWRNKSMSKGEEVSPAKALDPSEEHHAEFLKAWQGTEDLVRPEVFDTYWRCGCGQINDIARTFCGKCKKEKRWVIDHINGNATVATAERLAEEAEKKRLAEEQAAQARALKKRKIRNWIGLGAAVVAGITLIVLIVNMIFIPGRGYAEGQAYLELDRYPEAYEAFFELGNYRDCPELLDEISRKLCSETSIAAGYRHVVKNNRLGKVTGVGYALDGAMMTDKWNAIRALAAGKAHSVGLHYSGTVMAVGSKEHGACDVKAWINMVQVGAGDQLSVGLKDDGTVMATGKNDHGQCKVDKWTEITAIAVGPDFVLGLKKDGTVVATGNNKNGQCNVSEWKDIIYIAAGNSHALGVKADGTVVAAGNNKNKACEVSDWSDIIAVTAGDEFTVGLKADRTLVATGKNDKGQINVEEITDAIGVVSGWNFTVVITEMGTAKFIGTNENGEVAVESWHLSI